MPDGSRVSDPLSPDQAKAQVIEVARNLVATLGIDVTHASVHLTSCNDQGNAPFRAALQIDYPLAASRDAADADTAVMLQRLRDSGWSSDPDFHSHAPNLAKDGVTVTFGKQFAGDSVRSIELLGECRDITTTNQTRGQDEPVNLK